MKFVTTAAAVGLLGATLIAAPRAPAEAHGFCGPLLPLCVAGAVVGAAATVATLPLAAAGAVVAPAYAPPYYATDAPPPAYYAPPPAYYPPTPTYYAPPAYYGAPVYAGPVVYAYRPHPRFWGRPHRVYYTH